MRADGLDIRVIDVKDQAGVEQVRRLFRSYAAELADFVAESLRCQDFEAEAAGLPGRYARPSGRLLLATVGAAPAGCVAMRGLSDGACEMKRLYVAPEFRGLRIGEALVEAIVGEAARAGHRKMVLDTLPEMAGAIALYRSFGFTEAPPYWDCPIERTMYMERSLSNP